MTDERLAEILHRAEISETKFKDVNDLISALREEKQRSEDLYKVGKGYENQYTELEKQLESERAKVEELQNIIDYIVDKESVITSYNKVKIIANPNYPARYITKDGLIDVK